MVDDVERTVAGTHMWVKDCMEVDAQVEALTSALKTLGTGVNPDGTGPWHYLVCPTRYGFPDCDKKCLDAQATLEGRPA